MLGPVSACGDPGAELTSTVVAMGYPVVALDQKYENEHRGIKR
jgi:hypothetical protein